MLRALPAFAVVVLAACGGEVAPTGDGGPGGSNTEGGPATDSGPVFVICPPDPPAVGTLCVHPGDGCRYTQGSTTPNCYAAVACIENADGSGSTWQTAPCN